ncbi:hypothetical protein SAMN04488694_14811 [Natrinema hispanicum]|uniref:Uncharacterized protein n=1 Tax=Natrinema hispanicum TaxID=392421 RepID=A0A1I0JMY6_9EURY|nr:hypothetical protein SAMN04488694_14811 [Natrinema hispanicum]
MPVRVAKQTVIERVAAEHRETVEPVIDAAIADLKAGGTVANQRPREPVWDGALDRRMMVVDFGGQRVKAGTRYCHGYVFSRNSNQSSYASIRIT